jgi:hypothetical protein
MLRFFQNDRSEVQYNFKFKKICEIRAIRGRKKITAKEAKD